MARVASLTQTQGIRFAFSVLRSAVKLLLRLPRPSFLLYHANQPRGVCGGKPPNCCSIPAKSFPGFAYAPRGPGRTNLILWNSRE